MYIVSYFYSSSLFFEKNVVNRILEHDKNTGRLRAKIEPITRKNSRLKVNITIFDLKLNNKYTIIQLSEGGLVNNISEFNGRGKSFRTMFRNLKSLKLCTLLDKPERRKANVYADYSGAQIPDAFVVGYGLDFDEKYRNLPFVGALKPAVYEKPQE